MSDTTQEINELLLKSVNNFPPFPETINELKEYLQKAGLNVELQKVAQILSKDPLVTAKLLQLANSPFYGFSSKITTIQQVLNLLGINNVKNIIIADSIKNNFKIDISPYGLDSKDFLKNCNKEAEFISKWLLDEDKKLAYLLVPCAMLLRFGMIVFSNFLIQNNKDEKFHKLLKQNHYNNIPTIEEEFLGVDHISFLGFLFHHWDFDEDLIETICFVNSPHSADESVQKNAYALAIANCIFSPYDGGSSFQVQKALSLIEEAKTNHINFGLDNFMAKLPDFAKANLNKPID